MLQVTVAKSKIGKDKTAFVLLCVSFKLTSNGLIYRTLFKQLIESDNTDLYF